MKEELYQELLNRHYLVLEEKRAVFTKKTQKTGSPLDRFRNEILFFRHEMNCSYRDIQRWLIKFKNVQRSPSRIADRIRQWEKENATKKEPLSNKNGRESN